MSNNSDILVIDRTTDCHKAILWLTLTGRRIIKYDTVYSDTEMVSSDGIRQFSGKVPRQADLFYGMTFTIPVSNFKLICIQEGAAPVNVFTAEPGEKVGKLEFASPIRLAYETWRYSYETVDGDIHYGFDDSVYLHKIMDPCFTFGLLRDWNTDTEFQPYSSATKVVASI